MNAFARRMEYGLRDGNVAVAFWGTTYGLGLSCCKGMSMTEKASDWDSPTTTISKAARSFIRTNALPPSWYMEQETDGYLAWDFTRWRRAMVTERSTRDSGVPLATLHRRMVWTGVGHQGSPSYCAAALLRM